MACSNDVVDVLLRFDIMTIEYGCEPCCSDDGDEACELNRNVCEIIAKIMEDYEVSRTEVPIFIAAPFHAYMRFLVAPTVWIAEKLGVVIKLMALAALVSSMFYVAWLAANLREHTHEYGTFEAVEHSKFLPLVVAFFNHATFALFVHTNKCAVKEKRCPPLPLLYSLFVGKCFALFRLVWSYSSRDMGTALEYFMYQELILCLFHAAASAFFVHSAEPGVGGIKCVMLNIFMIDAAKTTIMWLFWMQFRPGYVETFVDRLPGSQAQIVLVVLVHVYLDILQSGISTFTVYIGRWGAGLCDKSDPNKYRSVGTEELAK